MIWTCTGVFLTKNSFMHLYLAEKSIYSLCTLEVPWEALVQQCARRPPIAMNRAYCSTLQLLSWLYVKGGRAKAGIMWELSLRIH